MPPEGPVEIPEEAYTALAALRDAIEPVIPQSLDFGIGIKRTGGDYTDQLALVVLVPEKLPVDRVPPEQLIPPEMWGFPTDVVEFRPVEILDHAPYDPLRGGIQISQSAATLPDGTVVAPTGTLGAVVRRRAGREQLLLTCQHVLPVSGMQVHQCADGYVGHRVVATSAEGVRDGNWLDAAVATPVDGQALTPDIAGVGQVRGIASVSLWEPVRKRGFRTELTDGLVVFLAIDTANGTVRGMTIDTFPFGGLFCWHGDSGSVVLNARDEVVGLLFAMIGEGTAADGSPLRAMGMAGAVDVVQDALDVDIAVAPGVTSVEPDTAAGALASFGQVTITGWGFDPGSEVTFGGYPALSVDWQGSGRLVVVPPPALGAGTVDVLVTNSDGDVSSPGPQAWFTF